jgi:hypothetical protein
MIGISENAVLAFCAALRIDIVAVAGQDSGPRWSVPYFVIYYSDPGSWPTDGKLLLDFGEASPFLVP